MLLILPLQGYIAGIKKEKWYCCDLLGAGDPCHKSVGLYCFLGEGIPVSNVSGEECLLEMLSFTWDQIQGELLVMSASLSWW